MKNLLLFHVLLVVSISSSAAIRSTITGVTIGNVHLVSSGQGKVYRGSEPAGKERELINLGITDVVIIKNQVKKESTLEIANWKKLGIPQSQIHYIPFEWKKTAQENVQCERVIEALAKITQVYQTSGRAVYFHCTAGEDRTGLVAGLFAQMISAQRAQNDIFTKEMCARGYEAGDHAKPDHVVQEIRAGLTPLYLKMASLIRNGEISLQRLDKRVCSELSSVQLLSTHKWVCSSK